MKFLLPIVLAFFFWTPFFSSVQAARSIVFIGNKPRLHGDEELTLTASASGFTLGESIYIKGAFYKEGSTSYFGFTKKNDEWIKNFTTTTEQRKIIMGEWDGQLLVKNDYESTVFNKPENGNGNYLLKIRFYTVKEDGDDDVGYWSENNIPIELIAPPPTPSNTPSPKPTSTPTKSPTPTNPPVGGRAPTQSAISSGESPAVTKSSSKVSIKQTPTIEETPEEDGGQVLSFGEEEVLMSPTPVETPAASSSGNMLSDKTLVISLGFIGAGAGILSLVTLVPIIARRIKENREYNE